MGRKKLTTIPTRRCLTCGAEFQPKRSRLGQMMCGTACVRLMRNRQEVAGIQQYRNSQAGVANA